MKGAKGFGRVFRRPRSPYWWISYPYRGREVRESSGSAVKQEAVDKLKERLAKIAQHIYVARRLSASRSTSCSGTSSATSRCGASPRPGRSGATSTRGGSRRSGQRRRSMSSCRCSRSACSSGSGQGYAPATISRFLGSLHQAYGSGRRPRRRRRCPASPGSPSRTRGRLRRHSPRRAPCPPTAPRSVPVVSETEPMLTHRSYRSSCVPTKNNASTRRGMGCVTDHRTRST